MLRWSVVISLARFDTSSFAVLHYPRFSPIIPLLTRVKEELQPAEMQQRCLIAKCMQSASHKISHIINRNTGIQIQFEGEHERKAKNEQKQQTSKPALVLYLCTTSWLNDTLEILEEEIMTAVKHQHLQCYGGVFQ